MTNFEETACKPTELLSMTGYTFDEFNALLPAFEQAVFECDRTHRSISIGESNIALAYTYRPVRP